MSIFLHYPGVTGDVTDRPEHTGWLAITEVDWTGISRAVTSHTSTRRDRESSNAEFAEIVLVRELDRATPELFLRACCGRGRQLTLHFTKTSHGGNGADTYLALTLHDALVARYSVAARRQPARRPKEKLCISFTAMEMRYTPFGDDNAPEAARSVGFDPRTNERI